nr:Endonuclease exonuclease phosphatase domain containing protein [Haemonchus contortus]
MGEYGCNVCNEEYSALDEKRTPRVLTGCGHTICQGCALSIFKPGVSHITCPFDRVTTPLASGDVRSLKKNFALLELIERIQQASSGQETKTKETAIKKTNDGHLFVLGAKVDGKNVGGVGFLVHRRIEHLVDSTEVLGPRLAILRLRIERRTTVSIVNCYAPTSTATDGEKDAFYKELEEVLKNERSYYKYVVGDFNAVIHEERPATARTGPHGIGETNENGERLMDLLEACNLFHGNSFFVKNEGRRWTWESPNAETHSEIDHVLTNRRWSLLDVSVVEAFRTGSDHRLVRAKIRLRAKLRRRDCFRPPPIRLPRYDTSAMEVAAVQYTWQEAQDLAHDYDLLVKGLLHCATASAISARVNSRSRIDGIARTLLQQRAAVYRNSSLLERATINKACRIAVRESIQRYKDTRLKEAAETRSSLKRCRKDLTDSRSIIDRSYEGRDGADRRHRERRSRRLPSATTRTSFGRRYRFPVFLRQHKRRLRG